MTGFIAWAIPYLQFVALVISIVAGLRALFLHKKNNREWNDQ